MGEGGNKMSHFERAWIWIDEMKPWLLMGLTTLLLGIAIAYYGGK